MGEIEHLVLVKQTTGGDVMPKMLDHCPRFWETAESCFCESESGACPGAFRGNMLKEIRSMEFMLECSYRNQEKRNILRKESIQYDNEVA